MFRVVGVQGHWLAVVPVAVLFLGVDAHVMRLTLGLARTQEAREDASLRSPLRRQSAARLAGDVMGFVVGGVAFFRGF